MLETFTISSDSRFHKLMILILLVMSSCAHPQHYRSGSLLVIRLPMRVKLLK